jgi:polyhydroxybutyrate depolymerase
MRALVLLLVVGCASQDTSAGVDGGAPDAAAADTAAPAGGTTDAFMDVRFDGLPLDGRADDLQPPAYDGGLVAARPYHFLVPSGYDPHVPTPLVILLHGYSATAVEQDLYWGISTLAQQKTFLYAYPDGMKDAAGQQFWNATDACCAFGQNVDDVAYINAIIDDVQRSYNVDAKRIYAMGHSNGGFMSHRLACDAPRIAAIVSLAGAVWNDPSKCRPAGPVSILEVHGDADLVINYNGGQNFGNTYPSAHTTVATWAAKNGCTGTLTDTGQTLDLDAVLLGAETTIERYAGCPAAGAVELWTIRNGSHVPVLQSSWGATIYDFLTRHPKP